MFKLWEKVVLIIFIIFIPIQIFILNPTVRETKKFKVIGKDQYTLCSRSYTERINELIVVDSKNKVYKIQDIKAYHTFKVGDTITCDIEYGKAYGEENCRFKNIK